jgi:hypothetical protein
MLLVGGLGEQERVAAVVQGRPLREGIEGVQSRIAEVVEEVSVDLVATGLGDGVDNAAGGLTELSRVVGGFGMEFLDGVE